MVKKFLTSVLVTLGLASSTAAMSPGVAQFFPDFYKPGGYQLIPFGALCIPPLGLPELLESIDEQIVSSVTVENNITLILALSTTSDEYTVFLQRGTGPVCVVEVYSENVEGRDAAL